MPVTAFEGVVKNGSIVLLEEVELPEGSLVYVVVPDMRLGAVDPGKIKELDREMVDLDHDWI